MRGVPIPVLMAGAAYYGILLVLLGASIRIYLKQEKAMSRKYKDSEEVPSEVLCARLRELADAVTKGPGAVGREFSMRVPAELDRDADIVLSLSARRMEALVQENAALEKIQSCLEIPLALRQPGAVEKEVQEEFEKLRARVTELETCSPNGWVSEMGEVIRAVFDNEKEFIRQLSNMENADIVEIESFYMASKQCAVSVTDCYGKTFGTIIETPVVLDWFNSLPGDDS